MDSTVGTSDSTEAIVVYNIENRERELIVTSENRFNSNFGIIQFLVVNTLYTRPIISVVDNAGSWKAGETSVWHIENSIHPKILNFRLFWSLSFEGY